MSTQVNEYISEFRENRDIIRNYAKENIAKIQKENKRGFNRKVNLLTYQENALK